MIPRDTPPLTVTSDDLFPAPIALTGMTNDADGRIYIGLTLAQARALADELYAAIAAREG